MAASFRKAVGSNSFLPVISAFQGIFPGKNVSISTVRGGDQVSIQPCAGKPAMPASNLIHQLVFLALTKIQILMDH